MVDMEFEKLHIFFMLQADFYFGFHTFYHKFMYWVAHKFPLGFIFQISKE